VNGITELLESLASQAHWSLLVLALIVALAVISRGATVAVDGASRVAVSTGLPPAIVGATVVSLGTTLPEVAVSAVAAASGDAAVAAGNAIGSVAANSGLIAAVVLFMGQRATADRGVRTIAATASVAVLVVGIAAALTDQFTGTPRIPRLLGLGFLLMLPFYVRYILQHKMEQDPDADAESGGLARSIFKTLLALAAVVAASRILVPVAVELSRRLGIPESVVAATVIAIGTSVPEFATAIAAARQGKSEIGLGTICGANVLNVLLVTGLAATISPVGLPADRFFAYGTVPFALGLSLVVLFAGTTRNRKLELGLASFLIAGYAAFVTIGLLAS
jgi:cation:H+ antiporter